MNFHVVKHKSLKLKITLLTLLLFLISIWLLVFLSSRLLHKELRKLLGQQQFSITSIVAADVNQEIDFRLKALEKVSEGISPSVFRDPSRLQALLNERPVLQNLFNGGYYAIRSDGTTIADYPVSTGRIGMNVSEKGWMSEALKGKTNIGKPVIGKMLKFPVFTIATPVRDTRGNVIGVLAGVVDLKKPNFIDVITGSKYGKTGDFLLVAPQYRLVVTSSDKSRVMEALPNPGVSPELDRFVEGYEGFYIFTNPKGVEVLVSAKGVPAAGWYVSAILPTYEAFSPIYKMRQLMIFMAIILTILSGVATWWILRHQLSPIFDTINRLSSLKDSDLEFVHLPVVKKDEVGQLIAAFNRLLENLALRQTQLIESEERNRYILKTAMSGIWQNDAQGRLLEVNESYCRMSGYSEQELLSMHISDLDVYDSSDMVLDRIGMIREQGEARFETRHRRKDGRLIDVEVSTQYRPIDGGQCVTFLQDITERKSMEEAMRFTRVSVENASDAVFWVTPDARIVDVNRAACSILGYTREELLELSVFEIDPNYNPDFWPSHFNELKTQGTIKFETEQRAKDGHMVPVEIVANYVCMGDEERSCAFVRDITERRHAEAERRYLEKQILHAQKLESLGVLAGGIAHDFNNILMAIIGNADLALMRINKESPAVENLRSIEQASARAADLAKQMLAYSGKGKFVVESLDMNALIEESLHMLEVSISKKAILRFNLTPHLPSVEADATQIRQIVINLVINASEAIGDRSGVIAISTGCMDCDRGYLKDVWLDENLNDGLYVYFEVADTGCGMDRETIARIFDPFFTTKFTGRGLGMAAVLGIVRGHKGAIKVYSEPGKGTSFKIILPASGRPAAIFNENSVTNDWKGEGTVLLVDDEETVRGIGTALLKELGFDVITACDGGEAVDIFRKKQDIVLVLLDLTMPHMDGEQCFRELRLIKPDVRVIMSSGYNEQEVTQKFVGKGLTGFIQKPYKLSLLKDTLAKILSDSQSGRTLDQ